MLSGSWYALLRYVSPASGLSNPRVKRLTDGKCVLAAPEHPPFRLLYFPPSCLAGGSASPEGPRRPDAAKVVGSPRGARRRAVGDHVRMVLEPVYGLPSDSGPSSFILFEVMWRNELTILVTTDAAVRFFF